MFLGANRNNNGETTAALHRGQTSTENCQTDPLSELRLAEATRGPLEGRSACSSNFPPSESCCCSPWRRSDGRGRRSSPGGSRRWEGRPAAVRSGRVVVGLPMLFKSLSPRPAAAAAATGDGWRGDGDWTRTQTSKYRSKKARRVPWGGAQTPPRNAPKRSPRTPPWESPKGGPWTSPGGGLWTPAGGVFCNPVGAALGAPRGPQVAPSGPQEGSRRASWCVSGGFWAI